MKRKALVQLHRTIVPIRDLPAALAGMRIVHLSDLHLSGWTPIAEETRQILGTVDFDFLVATGDFTHNPPHWQKTLDLLARFFDPIASITPTYAVLGNHDLPQIAEHHQTPIQFLRNESTTVRFNGANFRLAGVEQAFGRLPRSQQALRDLEKALDDPVDASRDHASTPDREIPTILLAHYPSTVFRLPAAVKHRPSAVMEKQTSAVMPGRARPGHMRAVDLVLSGHTHGGQIRLPGLGCIWANDPIPLRFVRGLHCVDNTLLHTSAGVGVSGPLRLRFNCPPELTLLSLQPARFIGPTSGDDAIAKRPLRALSRV